MFAWSLVSAPASAQEKTTFQDQILPLVQANCAKCHNADKKKADLDLTSYASLLKGSGSGAIVLPGNVENSKIWKAITHAEEPFMPPNGKLADNDLEVFKRWIAGGLLENSGAKALATAKSGPDLELKSEAIGKPEGPPPMPNELPIEPVVHTLRGTAITGLAASPWAPLVAVAGQKQVLVYNTDTLELLGILPFTEGQLFHLGFSRNGKLLLASGGRSAKSGRVMIWDITTGEPLVTLGKEEYDSVLASDIRPAQSEVAVGGPSRLIHIYSVQTGKLRHSIKKHTDWVTAVAYSPSGQMLASADRSGGISIWDADTAQELFVLAGHKGAVTALNWRPDSKLLASSSEDGTVKLWEPQEGKQVKTWTANAGGALSVSYSQAGQLVSCGRDNTVTLWDQNGGKPRHCQFFGNIALRAVFASDSKRVLATDFEGRVGIWSAEDQKLVGELNPNPVPLKDQIAAAQAASDALQARVSAAAPKIASAQAEIGQVSAALEEAKKSADGARSDEAAKKAEVARLSTLLGATNSPPDLPSKLAAASAAWAEACTRCTNASVLFEAKTKALESAKANLAKTTEESPQTELAESQAKLKRLQAAHCLSAAWQLRPVVSARQREHDEVAAALAANRQSLKQSEQDLAAAKEALSKAEERIKSAQAALSRDEPAEKQIAADLSAQREKLEALLGQYRNALKSDSRVAEARK